jgi:hypothetical protein
MIGAYRIAFRCTDSGQQGPDTGLSAHGQRSQPGPYENAVFPLQRHLISHRSEGDEVQVLIRLARRNPCPIEQCLGQLECDTDPGQRGKRILTVLAHRVHHRDCRREPPAWPVVVGDDHVAPLASRTCHGFQRRDPAVCRHDQRRPDASGPLETGLRQIVTVSRAVRHERFDDSTESSEGVCEERRG